MNCYYNTTLLLYCYYTTENIYPILDGENGGENGDENDGELDQNCRVTFFVRSIVRLAVILTVIFIVKDWVTLIRRENVVGRIYQ